MVFLQVFFGAVIRHLPGPLAQRAHVLLAFVVVATALWVVFEVWELGSEQTAAKGWAWVLAGLIGVQLILGVEAWLGRFGSGVPSELQQSIRLPGRDALGSLRDWLLIFSTTVILALCLHRGLLQGWRCG